jgi:hypothetical protein
MQMPRSRDTIPVVCATAIVGLLLCGLLVGIEPVGGDPDQMYRPVKSELARSLVQGALPFWSDRLGVGVPVVAESHAAAFYPPNWLLYRYLDVETAYRLAMWFHHMALVLATYAYAHTLGISRWGAALAAVAFTLCGFQAVHAIHEPFYHILPYLVFSLFIVERFVASGNIGWLGLLAIVFGAELTLGHFQLQAITAILVVFVGGWRLLADRRPWWRGAALVGALVCGAGIAAVQLVPTWEMMSFAGATYSRLDESAYFFAYPPAHWAEIAIPRLFRWMREGPMDPYWIKRGTSPLEAALYVGTIPLVLVFLGWPARNRGLGPWRVLVPVGIAVATLPNWWPAAYGVLLRVPVIGSFRAPARYTVVASIGLCLIAGAGLDEMMSRARFGIGLALGVLFGIAAFGWAFDRCGRIDYRQRALEGGFAAALLWAGLAWAVAIAALIAWRTQRLPSAALVLVTAVELGLLYFTGMTAWGWPLALSSRSVVLRKLAAERPTRVAGFLYNLPVRMGFTPAAPYLGFRELPPYRLLEPFKSWERAALDGILNRMKRFGVTHGVWDGPYERYMRREGVWRTSGASGLMFFRPEQVVFTGEDPVLDRAVPQPMHWRASQTWRVVRYTAAFPPARVAFVLKPAKDAAELERMLDANERPDEAWYVEGDVPSDTALPRARSARVLRWDGFRGQVEHDGTCELILTRAYYPGWMARVDNRAEEPVLRVEGGLQAIRLNGSGLSRVEVRYRPSGRASARAASLVALGLATAALLIGAIWAVWEHRWQNVS